MSWFAVFALRRNDRIYIFAFEKLKVLAVCVSRIGCDSLDLFTGVVLYAFYLSGKLTAFVLFAGSNIHVNDDAAMIVNGGMLLITGLHTKRIA